MSESNRTHFDQVHRIFISAAKTTADRTGLYIIVLLCLLLFILIFYLVYNFISYKRYCSIRRKNNLHCYSEKSLSNEEKLKKCLHSHEQLILDSHHLPLRIGESITTCSNTQKLRRSSSSKRPSLVSIHRVSDV